MLTHPTKLRLPQTDEPVPLVKMRNFVGTPAEAPREISLTAPGKRDSPCDYRCGALSAEPGAAAGTAAEVRGGCCTRCSA